MSFFKTCPNCKKILISTVCRECNQKATVLTVDAAVIKADPVKVETDSNTWVGPTEKRCNNPDCGAKTIYFMITTPPSPDEPPIITHKCFTCNKKRTVYKN
jgi:DNA-directed RNA polymerase subunit M/transcription elongation factor TFIIS